jgi:hypothetical protein
MLFVYHGQDVASRKQATEKLRSSLLKKRPEAEVFEIDTDEFSPGDIKELVSSRGLFEDKYVVFLFHVLTTEEGEQVILEQAKDLAAAEHVFVLIEDDIDKKSLKRLKKHTEALQEFTAGPAASEYKPFPLSDAYGKRAKKPAWLELQAGIAAGQRAESLHGVLAWQTRLMLLAMECDSAKEAGVSAYPFKKARGFSKNFSRDELEDNFRRLVQSYHEAHRGQYKLTDALEQFLLEL